MPNVVRPCCREAWRAAQPRSVRQVPKAETFPYSLLVIRKGGLSLFGSHGKGTGPRVSHCDAIVPVEVNNFQSQKNFQLFFKTDFPLFQDSGIISREKIFSDFQTTLSPGIAMRSQRQKLSLTCNQKRRALPVRITWKGDWTSGVSLRCDSASRGQKFSKSKKFSTFFRNMFAPCFRTLG